MCIFVKIYPPTYFELRYIADKTSLNINRLMLSRRDVEYRITNVKSSRNVWKIGKNNSLRFAIPNINYPEKYF